MMHKNHVHALLAAWNEGDLDGLDVYVNRHIAQQDSPIKASNADSLASLKEVIADFRRQFPDIEVTIEEVVCEDDRSFARWGAQWKFDHSGVVHTLGSSSVVSGCSFVRYEENEIADEFACFEVLGRLIQLGLAEGAAA